MREERRRVEIVSENGGEMQYHFPSFLPPSLPPSLNSSLLE